MGNCICTSSRSAWSQCGIREFSGIFFMIYVSPISIEWEKLPTRKTIGRRNDLWYANLTGWLAAGAVQRENRNVLEIFLSTIVSDPRAIVNMPRALILNSQGEQRARGGLHGLLMDNRRPDINPATCRLSLMLFGLDALGTTLCRSTSSIRLASLDRIVHASRHLFFRCP